MPAVIVTLAAAATVIRMQTLVLVLALTQMRVLALTIMRLLQSYQRRGAIAGILEAVLAEVQAVETAVLQKQRDMANLIAEG